MFLWLGSVELVPVLSELIHSGRQSGSQAESGMLHRSVTLGCEESSLSRIPKLCELNHVVLFWLACVKLVPIKPLTP